MKNRFTKSELNTCITWSSSKYNQYKKSEVIDSILKLQDSDEDGERTYSCGSWTEPTQKSRYSKMKSMNCQGTYIFKKVGNVVSLQLPNGLKIVKRLEE